jgi:proline iminopeptidase
MSEAFVTTPDGVRLWTTVQGDGPLTVLVSNGGAGCCDYLAPLAALWGGEPGLRVVRWEQRGCGRSGGDPEGPFTIAETVTDMEAVRAHYGAERWAVAGHSWGADLSLIYALAHPGRTLGVLCLAGGRLNNDREWHAAYDRGLAEGRETPPAFDYPPNLAANKQLNAEYKRYVQRPTLWRGVADLPVPALFLYGADDIRPAWAVEQVARLMPRGRFVLVPGADHYLHLSHPDTVRAESLAFLRSLPAD